MPAYNAEKLMESVIRNIPSGAWDKLETLLIVNDGSSDTTGDLGRSLSKEFTKIVVVDHPENRGYGEAQKTAFDWAKKNGADSIVMLHSDGQYPPEFLLKMIAPLESGADVVGGSRTMHGDMRNGGMSQIRYWGTVILNWVENTIFRANLSSYHSGYKAYGRKALEQIPYCKYSRTFNFDSEMLVGAIRAGLNVVEIPIPTIHGEGYSSLKPIPYGFSVLHTLWRFITKKI
ncbi:MAG: glycosyltransferase family 2 protein [Candidatus Sabulitectum sp.]|nr:glycosyltransferase family 2 protein [Candidatus Sabulitectum sp.]